VLTSTHHEVNPETFDARRAAAHAGEDVLLRETTAGYRYLRRDGRSPAAERVLASGGAAERVRTLVAGVIVDPNITVPLPFAGLSYLDFDFLGTGAQFNGFFGGSYGQLAWSVPSLGRSRWQIGGTVFGTAAEYHDRAFEGGIERYAENLRQRPAHATIWVVRPLRPRVWFRAAYEMDYKRLRAADTTARNFVVPVSPLVHGLRVSLEAQRGPWKASAWWNPGLRQRWGRWGRDATGVSDHRDFQRFGATVTRSVVLSRSIVGRIEAAAMGGRDLDRFSRYTFGTFDNRLRGYPGASIRYDSGLVGRGAMSWTAMPGVRIDGFVDSALVRDPGLSDRPTGHTGVGGAVELPLAFSTLMAAEFGYGVQARNVDGSRGTKTFQVTLFKAF
jgi:hypothetical protein